jgi:hypothetical protein
MADERMPGNRIADLSNLLMPRAGAAGAAHRPAPQGRRRGAPGGQEQAQAQPAPGLRGLMALTGEALGTMDASEYLDYLSGGRSAGWLGPR